MQEKGNPSKKVKMRKTQRKMIARQQLLSILPYNPILPLKSLNPRNRKRPLCALTLFRPSLDCYRHTIYRFKATRTLVEPCLEAVKMRMEQVNLKTSARNTSIQYAPLSSSITTR